MEHARRDAALERLDALIGEWTMEAAPPDGPNWPGEARVRFEWLEGRMFVIQRWTVDLPEAPDGIAIIGAGDEPDSFRQYYFDSRGVARIYEMTSRDGIWRLWREAPDPFPSDSARLSARTARRSPAAGRRQKTAPHGRPTST